MRYLRMLSNSVAAATLGTVYVLTLVIDLNPALPLTPSRVAPLVGTIGVYYAFHLTVLCYILLVLRQLLARRVFSPAWISVSVLVWLGAVIAAAGAALMWVNLSIFALVLDGATAASLDDGAVVLSVATGAFLLLALLRSRAPDARAAWGTLLVIITAGSVVAPLVLRGRGVSPVLEAAPIGASIDPSIDASPSDRSARVAVIAIDGGSLDLIAKATAEGRLPNFGRILDGGAVRHLATLHPTSAEAVWAAVATGKLPQKNGVRSAGIYQLAGGGGSVQLLPDYCFAHGLERLGFLVATPHTSATFRTRTIWSVLGTHGFTVGVVGWPLTQPAPVVRGYLVADTYPRVALTPSGIDDPSALYPPELQAEAAAALDSAMNEAPTIVTAADDRDPRDDAATRTDLIYDRIARTLATAHPAQVTLTRYQGLDALGHYFLRFAMPSEFGDVSDDEHRRLGGVLERHYAVLDEAIGRAMAALGSDDLLLVVSGYGMEPLNLGRRLIERVMGDPDLSGTHDAAPDGFLMAYGASVARSRPQTRASVVDVAPTLLYFLGLPVGRDMDGYVRTDLFRSSFTEDRPITYIPTYDR
jgi:predicted AlkP superfamily phosphohydrolase/phosphomutase